jgi:hypothetical protein
MRIAALAHCTAEMGLRASLYGTGATQACKVLSKTEGTPEGGAKDTAEAPLTAGVASAAAAEAEAEVAAALEAELHESELGAVDESEPAVLKALSKVASRGGGGGGGARQEQADDAATVTMARDSEVQEATVAIVDAGEVGAAGKRKALRMSLADGSGAPPAESGQEAGEASRPPSGAGKRGRRK